MLLTVALHLLPIMLNPDCHPVPSYHLSLLAAREESITIRAGDRDLRIVFAAPIFVFTISSFVNIVLGAYQSRSIPKTCANMKSSLSKYRLDGGSYLGVRM